MYCQPCTQPSRVHNRTAYMTQCADMTMLQQFRLPPTLAALVLAFVLQFATAQYPPPASYQNILTSPLDPNITIAYKQPPAGTCSTAFSTQKQYTGYIGIPPYTLAPVQQNYSINTFFWFVEARQTPEAAPLTIWLNGGPGSSSMVGFFNENGPCEVVQVNDGTYGTQHRMWGWDRSSNMLYIDQPNQVGFSYDIATNASFDLYTNQIFEPATTPPSPGLPSYMYLNGTFGSANSNLQPPYATTANTTQIAAQATWHFLQAWLSAFPQYNPAVRPNATIPNPPATPAGVNLFTESYGGKYGPVFASYFEQQNQARLNGSIPSNSTLAIQLASVGILNGQIDDLIQDYYYPMFAYNNTYGIQAYTQTQELNSLQEYSGANQCQAHIQQCRAAMNSTDAEGHGDVASTNELCNTAYFFCANITTAYYSEGYDPYDIRQKLPTPDPPAAYQEYLNNASVLAAVGARVNYTESSPYVQAGFISTGDSIRGGLIDDLAYLLNMGIRVALIYGDADYVCNWYGGQAVSLAIAQAMAAYQPQPSSLPGYPKNAATSPVPYASGFPAAGYASIITNATYVGGAVRQFGNLSFSRIYDSGHFVPYYQPETAYTVFTRVITGTDISTGEVINSSTFGSIGPANATYQNSVPASPATTCWIRSINETCNSTETSAVLKGQGSVVNGIFVMNGASVALPSSTVVAGVPGSPQPSSSNGGPAMSGNQGTTGLTGVYTATATPSQSSKAAAAGRVKPGQPLDVRIGPVVTVLLSIAFGALLMT